MMQDLFFIHLAPRTASSHDPRPTLALPDVSLHHLVNILDKAQVYNRRPGYDRWIDCGSFYGLRC